MTQAFFCKNEKFKKFKIIKSYSFELEIVLKLVCCLCEDLLESFEINDSVDEATATF